MPLQATSGAASYDGFGGGAAVVPAYIEEIFSTWLYTGNGSTQTITNGIDLSTKGGLVWIKSRAAGNHFLYDTTRGVNNYLKSNSTDAQVTTANSLTAFNTTGFSIGDPLFNDNAVNYVSWTFREQPKFFDVVTFTQVGTSGTQTISHNLGSVPGCIIFKAINQVDDWYTYHRSIPTQRIRLNTTAAANSSGTDVANTLTSTTFGFNVGNAGNANGTQFVAYLFAHDAGGFGLTGTDNVISCGSFTSAGDATDVTVELGYEPQWIMVKNASVSSDWEMFDVMRGMSNTNSSILKANKSDAETNTTIPYYPRPTATGFIAKNSLGATAGNNIIYIAIRRGPMKVPTLGTSVYNANPFPADAATNNTVIDPGFPVDLVWLKPERSGVYNWYWQDRLRGKKYLYSNATDAEVNSSTKFDYSNGYVETVSNSSDGIGWAFRRAPGFFDEVCYTGNYAGNPQVPHNLGVAPEMLIARSRVSVGQWYVKHIGMSDTEEVYFNAGALSAGPTWVRTSTYWQYSSAQYPNDAHVAYLFATCAGVSKVGSYTGTATTKQIDCGFTGGARFVLIKRTDSTGDWYVWDSARGIVAGNDPYLLLNSTAAEVTSTDYVDTYSAGFEISSTAPAAINASGGSFIFLAIA